MVTMPLSFADIRAEFASDRNVQRSVTAESSAPLLFQPGFQSLAVFFHAGNACVPKQNLVRNLNRYFHMHRLSHTHIKRRYVFVWQNYTQSQIHTEIFPNPVHPVIPSRNPPLLSMAGRLMSERLIYSSGYE
jgi:hypothetical protein